MGSRRFVNDYGRPLLLGTRNHDAARRRSLRFLARSIRKVHRVLVWLDFVSGDSNRDHRCGSDCVCEISRRFCRGGFAGQLFRRADFIGRLRD